METLIAFKKLLLGEDYIIADPREGINRRIKLILLFICSFTIVCSIPWISFFIIKSFYSFAVLQLCFVGLYSVFFWGIRSAKHRFVRISLIITTLFQILSIVYFWEGVGILEYNVNHFYFLLLMFTAFLILYDAHYLYRWTVIIINGLLFGIIQYQLIDLPYVFNIGPGLHQFGRHFVIVVVFIFFGLITKLFVDSILKTESALYQANELQKRVLEKILPGNIVGRLRKEGKGFVDRHISCSVLYADIVGFTKLSDKLSPTQIVLFLNQIFGHFDDLTEKSGLQKIKTIGDAYMVASCSPMVKIEDHADAILNLSMNFLDVIKDFKDISIRIGINSGMVMEGVIGGNKFSYDLWGEAVALASKMETTCTPGNIHITQSTHSLLKNRYEFIKINPLKNDGLPTTSYQLKLLKVNS